MNTMNDLIRSNSLAMYSVLSVLAHADISVFNMNSDQMIDAARNYTVPCAHSFTIKHTTLDNTRCCSKCGSLQTN